MDAYICGAIKTFVSIMLLNLSLVIFYLVIPALLLVVIKKVPLLQKLGVVLLSYGIGLLLGNINLLPKVPDVVQIQEIINSLTIPLALPLLLFSLNIRSWFNMAGKAFIALVTGLVSVVVMVVLGYLLFNDTLTDAWKIAGMLIGVYSGGTPNLAAIQSALGVNAETYLMVNTVDIVLSSIFLLIIMTFGKGLLRKILPAYENAKVVVAEQPLMESDDYKGILTKKGLSSAGLALLISILIVAVSIGFSFLVSGGISMLVLILSITTLSIAASFFDFINKLNYSFQTGMYLILIFCVVVSSMANLKEMGDIAMDLLYYLSFVVFGSLALHIVLAKIFKIDADTLMVSSAALICSPPFVPVVAGALKNKDVIISGLTVGIIGYAIGNYLGVSIAYLLNSM